MQRFEFTGGTSNKFWAVQVEGTDVHVTYGAIGTEGRSQTKSFDSPDAAEAHAAKQIKGKVKKGYVRVGTTEPAGVAWPLLTVSDFDDDGFATLTPPTKPTFSYDEGLEPALVAILAQTRKEALGTTVLDEDELEEWREEQARIADLWSSMPNAVRAFVHTAHLYGGYDLDTGGTRSFESLETTTLDFHGMEDEITEVVEELGGTPANILYLGSTGGGEDNLLLLWEADTYRLAVWAIQEGELTDIGSFADLATYLHDEIDPEEISTVAHALFVAVGLIEPEEAGPDGPVWQSIPEDAGDTDVVATEAEQAHLGKWCRPNQLVRVSDGTLLGFASPNTVAIRDEELLKSEWCRGSRIVVSPSGHRYITWDRNKIAYEHVLGDSPETIIDTPTACSGLDYVDDDTVVVLGEDGNGSSWLMLLVRHPEHGEFEEADHVRQSGDGLAAAGGVIVVDGSRKVTVYSLDGQQLVKRGQVAHEARGILKSHPPQQRTEIRVVGQQTIRLLHADLLPPGKTPKAPKKNTQVLRRRAGGAPYAHQDYAFRTTVAHVYPYPPIWTAEVKFRRADGFVGASHNKEGRLLLTPDNEVKTVADYSWTQSHPTAARALSKSGGQVHEEDLQTGEAAAFPAPAEVAYVHVDGVLFFYVWLYETQEMRLYATGDAIGPGAMMATLDCSELDLHGETSTGVIVERDDKFYHASFGIQDGTLTLTDGPQLVLGKRFELQRPTGRAFAGRDYVEVDDAWFIIDPQ